MSSHSSPSRPRGRAGRVLPLGLALCALLIWGILPGFTPGTRAQTPADQARALIGTAAQRQIAALLADKHDRTPAQRKLDSDLL